MEKRDKNYYRVSILMPEWTKPLRGGGEKVIKEHIFQKFYLTDSKEEFLEKIKDIKNIKGWELIRKTLTDDYKCEKNCKDCPNKKFGLGEGDQLFKDDGDWVCYDYLEDQYDLESGEGDWAMCGDCESIYRGEHIGYDGVEACNRCHKINCCSDLYLAEFDDETYCDYCFDIAHEDHYSDPY